MSYQLRCFRTIFQQLGFIHLAFKLITYIDIQTLNSVISIEFASQKNSNLIKKQEKTKQKSKAQNKILQIIKSYCFIKQYLNKADRSMYYSFYQEPQFIQIQKQFIQQIVVLENKNQTQRHTFSQNFVNFMEIFNKLEKEIQVSEDEINEIKRIFTDPNLPLPSLKSAFQLFLVGLRFSHNKEEMGYFEDLKEKLLFQQQIYLKRFLQIQKQKNLCPKKYQYLHLVRYAPYQINFQNFNKLLISDHQLHNLIVYIFVLTEIYIQSVSNYINLIQDPFYKFSQIMSRYSIFRSFVMEIQDNLGFLFESYDNLYADSIRDSVHNKPKYCFWRPAMTKWFVKMNKIHNLTNQVYFMLLTKIRQEHILNLPQKYPYLKKYQICIKNGIQLSNYSQQMKHMVYNQKYGQSLLENFIQSNPQTIQSLIFQYVEYIIDLAVNEQTVHWCGHSKHKLETPYDLFNEQFKLYNDRYLNHLNDCLNINEKQSKWKVFQIFVQQQIQFLEDKNVKPLTLRQIVEEIKMQGKYLKSSDKQYKEVELLIHYDYEQKDEKLNFYNQKAKILQSIQGDDKYFFSIPPLISPQQLLIKSIDTNDTSEYDENQSNSSYEYISENEIEQDKQISESIEMIEEQKWHEGVRFQIDLSSQDKKRQKRISQQQDEESQRMDRESERISISENANEQNQSNKEKEGLKSTQESAEKIKLEDEGSNDLDNDWMETQKFPFENQADHQHHLYENNPSQITTVPQISIRSYSYDQIKNE